MSVIEFPKFCIMGAYRKLHFWKSSLKVLIHAVDISTCIHPYNDVVVVGPSRVDCYWKFEVFPIIELSPVSFNMVNHLKHIYPWWIWLPVSNFNNVSIIIILHKVSPLGGSLLALTHFVEVFYFVTFLALDILGWTPLS